MTKVFKSEINVDPAKGDQLIDVYENIWCVIKVYEDSVKVAKVGRNSGLNGFTGRSYRAVGTITWNPTLRVNHAKSIQNDSQK